VPPGEARILILIVGCVVSCVQPIPTCARDSDCNPGRLCSAGTCTPAEEVRRDAAAPQPGPDATGEPDVLARPDAPDAGAGQGRCSGEGGDCGWTPALLTGLVLWLDAGFGTTVDAGGMVSRWRDRSGLDNDAVSDAPSGPVVVPNGASGLPLLLFHSSGGPQGVHLRIRDAPSLRWARDPFAIVVVATSTNVQKAPGSLFRKRPPLPPAPGLQLFAEGRGDGRLLAALRPDVVSYETIADGFTTGAPFAFGVRRSESTTLELRVNGRRDGRVRSNDVDVDISGTGTDALLGAGIDEAPACCQLYGGIAEVVAVHGPLSDDDLFRLERYVTEKYGLH
jgi:hypothetical protein